MQKAIVIGAGIGGIASAIRLRAKGYEVDVFEANSYPGGKLSQFNLGDFRFDAGPSLFTLPEMVDELFDLAGEDPKDHFNYQQLDEICVYFYEDGTRLTAYADKERFAVEVEEKLGVPANKTRKQLTKSAFIYEATEGLFLQQSLHKWKTYLKWSTFVSFLKIPFLNIFTTMNKANKRALKNPKLVQLFNRYATYNGSNPYKAPGILNIIPHLEFNKGAYFPEGGMHSITTSLVKLAESKGVRFHYQHRVDKIEVENKQAKGIWIQNELVEADQIVCNMDVVPAYRNLLADQVQPEKILRQERSSSALIFYWGITKVFPELKVHNIFFSKDYEHEFAKIFDEKTVGDDPTVYIHISSKLEKNDAPENMENWFVMINVPANGGQDWDHLITRARRNILSKLSRLLDEEVEKLIEVEDFLDPRSIETRTQSFQGALYGTASNERMAAFFRHPNFSNKIKNLYFCGGSVHPGGGIPLALSSAKIIDSMIK